MYMWSSLITTHSVSKKALDSFWQFAVEQKYALEFSKINEATSAVMSIHLSRISVGINME